MNDSQRPHRSAEIDRVYDLASQCLSGEAGETQVEELERLLLDDSAAREVFFEFMQESSFLYVWATDFESVDDRKLDASPQSHEAAAESAESVGPAPTRRITSILNRASRRPRASSIVVASLAMAAGLLIMAIVTISVRRGDQAGGKHVVKLSAPAKEVATMSGWQRVIWKQGIRHPQGYQPRLKVGERLVLDRGLVEITYDTGMRVVLQGPAVYEVLGKKHGFLQTGRLTARAEIKKARGFIIDTPTGSVKDLGTEFGVAVNELGVQMHVLSGSISATFVPAGTDTSETRILREDESLGISREGLVESELPAEVTDSFVSISKRLFAQSKRPSDTRQFLVENPDLLVHYPFVRGADSAKLVNLGRGGQKMDATIHGAKWTEGHSPNAQSLSIAGAEDHIRMNVPGKFSQLTIAMWVRVESLERAFHGLVMSDGWNRNGQVHWQILRDGQLELAIHQATPYVHFANFRLEPKRWYHLAVACDTGEQRASLFVDGRLVDRQQTPQMPPLVLAAAEIGNWASTEEFPDHVRHLGGQVGELMIFTRTLNEREVRECFLASKQRTIPIEENATNTP